MPLLILLPTAFVTASITESSSSQTKASSRNYFSIVVVIALLITRWCHLPLPTSLPPSLAVHQFFWLLPPQ
jgi:hypothetical protein